MLTYLKAIEKLQDKRWREIFIEKSSEHKLEWLASLQDVHVTFSCLDRLKVLEYYIKNYVCIYYALFGLMIYYLLNFMLWIYDITKIMYHLNCSVLISVFLFSFILTEYGQ